MQEYPTACLLGENNDNGDVTVVVSASFAARAIAHERHGAMIIKGMTRHGRIFRPSDWAQRLAEVTAVNCGYCLGKQKHRTSPYVKATFVDSVPSIWISPLLSEIDPPVYDFVMRFGSDNELQIFEAAQTSMSDAVE